MSPTVFLVSDSLSCDKDTETLLLRTSLSELGANANIVVWDDQSVRWTDCDLCIIRSTWDYINRIDEYIAWLDMVREKTNVCNPVNVIKWNLHKSYLLELQQEGVSVISTRLIRQGSLSNLSDILMSVTSNEIIIKPCVSINALGTKRFKVDDGEAEKHYLNLLKNGDVLIQPFISEILEKGEVSLIFLNKNFSHAVRKIGAKGDFRIHQEYGGRVEKYLPSEADIELATNALSKIKDDLLYARIDIVLTNQGPKLMELELIEPTLFFSLYPEKMKSFSKLIYDEAKKSVVERS